MNVKDENSYMAYLDAIKSRGRLANPFFCLMEIDPVSFEDGKARLAMTVRPDMLNGEGWLQGGMYSALADEAMALAIYTLLKPGEMIATISGTTTFMRGVRSGLIYADATVIKKGRQIIVVDAVVSEKDGDHALARCNSTFIMRQ